MTEQLLMDREASVVHWSRQLYRRSEVTGLGKGHHVENYCSAQRTHTHTPLPLQFATIFLKVCMETKLTCAKQPFIKERIFSKDISWYNKAPFLAKS